MYDLIKAQLSKTVPFANHAGVEILEVSEGAATAHIPLNDAQKNHLGTQHAGALFTVGEAASGAAFAGGFMPVIMEVVPVAANAQIRYSKPARTAVTAIASVSGKCSELIATCKSSGKVEFDVSVVLTDDEAVEVATMTVQWNVKLKK